MICPTCKKEGRKSKVFNRGGTSTLMYSAPFYDEDGVYHNHNPNIIKTYYTCSNGHEWMEKRGHKCKCGWENKV